MQKYGPYQATVVELIDPATIRMIVDIGFGISLYMVCNVANYEYGGRNKPGARDMNVAYKYLQPMDSIVVTSYDWQPQEGTFNGRVSLVNKYGHEHDYASLMISNGVGGWSEKK